MAGTITLYHYTTKEGKKAIRDSGVIYESTGSGIKDDARFGDGVYLTALPPSHGKIKLAMNNYNASMEDTFELINWGKVDSFVAVDMDRAEVGKVRGKRSIFLFPGDLILEDDMNPQFGNVSKTF